ncbi:MAG: FG-GAP repeat domain-containing protein, partial [Caldilineaceae bacterium]
RNRLADMNGDGRLDAVVGYEAISKEGTLAWYEQPRTATNLWTEHVIANDVIGPMSLDVADMDGDGDIDVVVGEHDLSGDAAPRMLVYENPGSETGTWKRHVVHTGDEHHDGAQLVDTDNDGDLDIVSIGWSHNDVLLYENQSCTGGGGEPQPTATNTPVPDPTDTPTSTPVPGSTSTGIYVSSSSGGSVGGFSFKDEDILAYDPAANKWSLFLDGSDVGLAGSATRDVDAFHVFGDDSILFSVIGETTLPDVGTVDDSDLILFEPTSLGANSAGQFSLYFDGSDVDLSTDNEDIDSIAVLENGDLVMSTLGGWSVGNISGDDEDLIRFSPTNLGSNTSGSWSLYFDGSDVALATTGGEDIWGASVDSGSGAVYLSFKNTFAVSGVSGDGADVVKCQPGSLGENTSCTFELVLDGSANGLGGELLDGLALQGLPGGSDQPDGTPTPIYTPTATPTATPVPGPVSVSIYVSSSSGGSVGGFSFKDEDILAYDPAANKWSLFLDGSDVGLAGSATRDVDAFHVFGDDSILFSVIGETTLPDVGTVDDSDLILFEPTSLGANSAGQFSLYFDGSDVDLSTDNEDIDSIAVLENGDLVMSTLGGWSVGNISGDDEDLIRFSPTNLGSNTSGSWSLYFDGSDVALATTGGEDIWGASVDSGSGAVYLSFKNTFAVSGVSGDGADVVKCQPGSLGENTSCTFELVLDGSANGLGGELLDGLALQGLPGGSDQPDGTPTPIYTPTATPPSLGDGKIYTSSNTDGSVGSVVFDDEDIIMLDKSTGNWSIFFDGSDVGLDSSAADIDAFHILANGNILISLAGDAAVLDLGPIDDSDIIQFFPQSLGTNTVGTFSLYFDGSDVDLTTSSDDIDALFVLSSGDLLVSMAGGDTAGGVRFRDEDILLFRPSSLGSDTAGAWSLYFDGSDVGLNDYISEDIWGIWQHEALDQVYFTTKDIFDVANISGDGADIVICQPSSTGTSTACSFALELDGSTSGLAGAYLDGIWIEL